MPTPRLIDVVAQSTPNPLAHCFLTTVELLPTGAAELGRGEAYAPSALLDALFALEGVERVYVAGHFVTVLRAPEADWAALAVQVRQALRAVLSQAPEGQPLLTPPAPVSQAPAPEAEPALQEWFRTRILPATERDGGAIFFEGLEAGQLVLQARGACQSCPYLAETVQKGILAPLRSTRPDIVGARVRPGQGPERLLAPLPVAPPAV